MQSPELVRHHYRTCNLCEAICGIEIVVQGEQIQAIRGDKDDPFSRGHICPKAVALQDVHNDPDRLKHPLRRTATGWQRIGWDEAFDEVARRLRAIQDRHGRDAVALFIGVQSVHNYGTILFAPPLLEALSTRNRYHTASLDILPHLLAAAQMFGHQYLLPIPDIDRTDFFVIQGANPLVSNGSLMGAPDFRKRVQDIRGRGGKLVVIDPRRTETARLADRHLFIRPGTDPLLLAAVLNVLRAENLWRPGRLAAFLDGLEALWRAIEGITPERVAGPTGVDPDAIRELARGFAGAEKATWYGRVGASQQEFGTLTLWLIYALNIVTGNLDRPGGAMFTRPAVDLRGKLNPGTLGRWRTRARGLPEFADELPAAALAEEILTAGEGQIRALLTSAGNPVLSCPNGRLLDKALAQLEFMVSVDIYLNETTRHAHIILPPTAALEHGHYDLAYYMMAIRNTARYSPPLFRPSEDTRHDWEIFLELATRLRSRGPLSWVKARLQRAVLRRLGPEGMLDLGLRFGPYGAGWKLWKRGLSLRQLKQTPHGVDLGPLEPCLPGRLFTPSKRIQLAPELFCADLGRLRARFDLNGAAATPAATGLPSDAPGNGGVPGHPARLVLIGRRDLRSNNTWMHNYERLVKGGVRCTLLMHPDDAARHGVADGQRVRVTSRVGSVEVPAEVSAEIMPGVVSLPFGWGHDREGTQLRTARRHAGASINDITDELAVDALSGMAAFSGVPVTVEPLTPAS